MSADTFECPLYGHCPHWLVRMAENMYQKQNLFYTIIVVKNRPFSLSVP